MVLAVFRKAESKKLASYALSVFGPYQVFETRNNLEKQTDTGFLPKCTILCFYKTRLNAKC